MLISIKPNVPMDSSQKSVPVFHDKVYELHPPWAPHINKGTPEVDTTKVLTKVFPYEHCYLAMEKQVIH